METPSLTLNVENRINNNKPTEEAVKKVKKVNETPNEQISAQNLMAYVLPNEMDSDIKPCIEKLAKVCIKVF